MWWTAAAGRLEQATALDPVTAAVTRAVLAVLPGGPVKDVLHGRWLGHPVHPLLVTAPIGLWAGAVLLDLTPGDTRRAAQRLVGAGALSVLPTAATGLADWSALGEFERPKRVGLVHAAANVVTTAVYVASWLARRRGDEALGRGLALVGLGGLAVGGFLGGHLSYTEGVGVDRNADEPPEPQDWTDAAADAEVAEGALVRVDVDGQQVVLARRSGRLSAMGAVCSHYGAPLEQGEVDDEECLVCPWHGSRFRLADGTCARGPAVSPQQSYEVRRSGDRLELRVRA